MNGAMVRAGLAGTKTQTRRVVKPQPHDCGKISVGMYAPTAVDRHGEEYPGPEIFGAYDDWGEWGTRFPYGQPGDRLYVREAFRFLDVFDGDSPATVGDRCLNAGYAKPWAPTHYEADGRRDNWQHVGTPPHAGVHPQAGKLRPGIHMPRWASRITLEIVSVRVERLNDITEADAIAEGIESLRGEGQFWRDYSNPDGANVESFTIARPIESFRTLWERINGAGSWAANPWVWVVEFRPV